MINALLATAATIDVGMPLPPVEVLLPLLSFAAMWGVVRANAATAKRDIEILRAEVQMITAVDKRLVAQETGQEAFKGEILRRLDLIQKEQEYQHAEHKRLYEELRRDMFSRRGGDQ